MRVYFQAFNIDEVGYDVNGYQEKPTQATDNMIRGVANINRSQLTFRNINLMAILGVQRIKQGGTFNIKLHAVKAINENGNNVIDYDSPPQLRTSNVFISGLTFLNGRNENYLCPFSNFNPNEELVLENVFFHRGDLSDFQHFYDYARNNQGGSTFEFYRLMWQETATTANTSLTRFRVNSSIITQLDNKIMRAGQPTRQSNDFFILRVEDAGDGTLPARVTVPQLNNVVTITILPENNQWFHRRLTDDVQEDDFNNELTAYIPSSHIVDLKFELRDVLTDTLQPVITEPNDKVYPSIEFVLDIY